MNLSRSVTLALPDISAVPINFSRVTSEDSSLDLATSFIQAGLGSMELWEKSGRNVPLFLKLSLNAWLQSIGAKEVAEFSDFSVAIEDRVGSFRTPKSKMILSIDTDCYMAIQVGPLLDALEAHAQGLGKAFFEVFISEVGKWIRPYDYRDSAEFNENWKESVRMELNDGEDFEAGCERLGIEFFPVGKDTPSYLPSPEDCREPRRDEYLPFLKKQARGKFNEVISDLLEIASLPPRLSVQEEELQQLEFEWEMPPVPALLVYFQVHDSIAQCFDEETRNIHEYWPEPQHFMLFDYANVNAVKACLEEVSRFMRVLRAIGRIGEAAKQYKEKSHDGDYQCRRAGKLLAA